MLAEPNRVNVVFTSPFVRNDRKMERDSRVSDCDDWATTQPLVWRYHSVMSISLEDALLNVWRQSLVENKKTVTLEGESFPVRSTAKRKLMQIDFQFDGKDLRGLEQNPDTKSRWAAMARNGKKVMQFLEGGRYVAVVAEGKVHLYAPKN
jgi:hypothetical protein